MELSYKEEVGVGALVVAGLIAFTVFMFWLTGRSITSKGVPVAVEFKNVSGLKEGDPVRVSGVKKGRVAHVRLDRVGRVTVTLQLDPEVRPHQDATAAVASADFLGAKFVDYNPGINDTLLVSGAHIKGVTDEQIADVNKGLNASELASDIHNTLMATQRGMEALTSAANGPAIKQTQQTLAALERVMQRLDTLLGASKVEKSGARLDTLSANLTQLTTRLADATGSLKRVLDRMDSGEGTIGKMASDTMLYRNLNETLTSLTALLKCLMERPEMYINVKVF